MRAPSARAYGAFAQHDHGLFRRVQNGAERVAARRDVGQQRRVVAEMIVAVGQIGRLADQPDREAAHRMPFPKARVDQRRFPARIGAHDQAGIGFLDSGDGRVEQIARAGAGRELRALLAAVDMGRAEGREQVLEHRHRLAVGEIPGDGGDAVRSGLAHPFRDRGERFRPACRRQLAVLPYIGRVEPLAAQPVAGEPRLVGEPLLVDVLVQERNHPLHLAVPGIDPDVAAHRVHHVDGFGLGEFPGPRVEGVGLGGQRADRAQIDDVARQLRGERLLEIGADLHMLAAPGGAELLDAGDLGHESDAARAVDAARHVGLDQRAEILVGHRALVLGEARPVETVGHRLVLQVALAALVADRAIERVVDEQELHHPLARFLDHRRVGADDHAVADRHRTGRDGLGRALHLDQAHAAIAGDRQALVIAEARNLHAGLLAGLENGDPVLHLDLAVDRQCCHCAYATFESSSLRWFTFFPTACRTLKDPCRRPHPSRMWVAFGAGLCPACSRTLRRFCTGAHVWADVRQPSSSPEKTFTYR